MYSHESSFRLKPLVALCQGLVLVLGVATASLPLVAQAQPGQAVVQRPLVKPVAEMPMARRRPRAMDI